ncbi:MAG: energy transducer TonB [Bacteroidota bacterium]
MESKKSSKADIKKKSFLYFQLGLIFMLSLSLFLIEWKTYEKTEIENDVVELDMIEDEDVPITQPMNQPPPPPPPPPQPEEIEVVEDDEEVEEDVIEDTETEMDEIVEVDEVADVEDTSGEEIEDVPFQSIQNVPVFPGCEKYDTNEERKQCMSQKIQAFVNKKFDTSIADELGLSGVNRVYVRFTIDQNGDVIDVQARSTHSRLTREGERVVNKLPSMTPGKQRGKKVRVIYNLPITFQVN